MLYAVLKKNEIIKFNFTDGMKIELKWEAQDHYDLCIFYKTKQGQEGGIFASEYGQKGSEGSLNNFPFMQLQRDLVTILTKDISLFSELYVVIINYSFAINDELGTFSGLVEFTLNNSNNTIKIHVDENNKGHIYVVGKIDCINNSIINEGYTLLIKDAYYQIPGFKTLCC